MGGINISRWLASGVLAGLVIFGFEGLASTLYVDDMMAALEAHGLGMELTSRMMALTVVVSLIAGMTLMFFYAAARPRFGPGPKTAVLVAVMLWFGGYLLSIIGMSMIGLYPTNMLAMWAAIGLVEMVLAALAGGALYRESAAPGV